MATPADLLSNKGCCKCKGKGFTSEDRKLFCKILHDNKYDYSKSDFSTSKNITTVICPEHGEFKIDFDHHFNSKNGCKYCSHPVSDTESFKKEAGSKHNFFYTYDKSEYVNSHTKLIITCPMHGDFSQTPNAHLNGEGCPNCAKTSILETKLEDALRKNNIKYEKGKKTKWLITEKSGHSHLDFFIPEINLAIECQGKQHFGLGGWCDKYSHEDRYKIDAWKKEQCEAHGIELIYFANKNSQKNYLGKIFVDEKELLDYIKYLFIK